MLNHKKQLLWSSDFRLKISLDSKYISCNSEFTAVIFSQISSSWSLLGHGCLKMCKVMTWYECSNLNKYNPPTIFETFVLFLFWIVDLSFFSNVLWRVFPHFIWRLLPRQTKKVSFNKVVWFWISTK